MLITFMLLAFYVCKHLPTKFNSSIEGFKICHIWLSIPSAITRTVLHRLLTQSPFISSTLHLPPYYYRACAAPDQQSTLFQKLLLNTVTNLQSNSFKISNNFAFSYISFSKHENAFSEKFGKSLKVEEILAYRFKLTEFLATPKFQAAL